MSSRISEPLRFECTQCGECCRVRGEYAHVYLNDVELDRLAEFLGLTRRQLRQRYTVRDRLGWTELVFENGQCTFLDPQSGRCTVYEARPTQCRTYPFWPELIANGRWRASARRMCEGLGRGREYGEEEVAARMREQAAWDDE